MRKLVPIPALFLLFGLAMTAWAIFLRQYISPWPGLAVAGIVVGLSALAIRALWIRGAWAPWMLLASGAVTLAAELLFPRLFPIVNASSEPPSPLALLWYPTSVVLVPAMTILAAWVARRSLRRTA